MFYNPYLELKAIYDRYVEGETRSSSRRQTFINNVFHLLEQASVKCEVMDVELLQDYFDFRDLFNKIDKMLDGEISNVIDEKYPDKPMKIFEYLAQRELEYYEGDLWATTEEQRTEIARLMKHIDETMGIEGCEVDFYFPDGFDDIALQFYPWHTTKKIGNQFAKLVSYQMLDKERKYPSMIAITYMELFPCVKEIVEAYNIGEHIIPMSKAELNEKIDVGDSYTRSAPVL